MINRVISKASITELLVVPALTRALTDAGETSFRVSTQKLEKASSLKEVIVRADGGPTENFLKTDMLTIYVYVPGTYAEANRFTNVLETYLQAVPSYEWRVTTVYTPLSSKEPNEGSLQVRSLTVELDIRTEAVEIPLLYPSV